MKQRGFITPSITGWIAVAAAIAFLAMGIALKVQTGRLHAEQKASAEFKAEVKAKGEAAIAKAKLQEAADQAKKEKADHENKTLRAANAALARQLRDERARSGFVPQAPAGTSRPDLACYPRADLERAIQRLDAGVSAIVDEGSAALIDLNTARRWAQTP